MYYKIPLRFQREVILHTLKNTQEHLLVEGTPSILGIFGPPGEGKTVMCKQILADLGACIQVMSVVEFESEDAGKPAERLRNKYMIANEHLFSSTDSISALIIDDADTALGKWSGDVQYTVNTQIIIGELMQLATNEKSRKVPIILTGNDFSKMYYPLRRSGRMTNFFWNPKPSERLDSVQMLFNWLTMDECLTLINSIEQFASANDLVRPPISFYSSIRGKLVDEELWSRICHERRNADDMTYWGNVILPHFNQYSCAQIIDLCEEELKQIKAGNQDYSVGVINDQDTK